MSSVPTPKGQTKHPTYTPTISNEPTYNPTVNPDNIVNTMNTRASYCGNSYELAVEMCSESTLCTSDEDCSNNSGVVGGSSAVLLCFPDISCSMDTSEWNGNNNDDEDRNNVDSLTNNGGHDPRRIQQYYYWYWSSAGVSTTLMMMMMLVVV